MPGVPDTTALDGIRAEVFQEGELVARAELRDERTARRDQVLVRFQGFKPAWGEALPTLLGRKREDWSTREIRIDLRLDDGREFSDCAVRHPWSQTIGTRESVWFQLELPSPTDGAQ